MSDGWFGQRREHSRDEPTTGCGVTYACVLVVVLIAAALVVLL
jgi:hypothetical protein